MPVVISSEVVLGAAPAIPLTHPRILWDTIGRRSGIVITPSTEAAGFEGVNAVDERTFSFWRPTALPATLEFQITAAEECDYAMIAAHTLGTSQSIVSFESYDGASWQAWSAQVSPGSDKVLAFMNARVTANRFRLKVDSNAVSPAMPSVGVVYIGKALAMERGTPLNYAPITMRRKTEARPQLADKGALLGRSIQRQGVVGEIAFNYLTASFVRASFDPFIEAARTHPFGWVWAPIDFPAEVAYLWTPSGSEDIRPDYANLQDRMNVKFNVTGIVQ